MISDLDVTIKKFEIMGVVKTVVIMDTFYAKSKKQAMFFFSKKYGYDSKILTI